jgi:hypothetical protein
MATKKMATKKPAAAMKKASPMKQTKPKGDSKEMKAYIAKKAAEKDADVKKYKHAQETELKKGVTKKSYDAANALVNRGNVKQTGVSYNFLTGQSAFDDFDKKYVRGGTYDKVVNTKTKQVAAEAKNPVSSHENQAFQSYLNPKNTLRMGNEDLRRQYVSDSIDYRGNQEKQLAYYKNATKRAGRGR